MNTRTRLLGVVALSCTGIVLVIWARMNSSNTPSRNAPTVETPVSEAAAPVSDLTVSNADADEIVRLRKENARLNLENVDLKKQLADLNNKSMVDALRLALKEPPPSSPARYSVRFPSSDAMRQFAPASAKMWSPRGAELMSQVSESDGEGYLIYGTCFRSISRVMIRGRIVPPSAENFRISVGPISLIFNWEMADENHFRNGESLTVVPGHLLAPGRTYTFLLEQQGPNVTVKVDAKEVYRTTATLEGTVTVSPARGSVIAISELEINGVPEPHKPVTGRSHANTF